MIEAEFFSEVNTHFKNNLPFVIYRKPNATRIEAVFQKNKNLYITEDFKDFGFVFAPFNSNTQQTVIIPYTFSKKNSTKLKNTFSTSAKTSNFKVTNTNKVTYNKTLLNTINALQTSAYSKIVISRIETLALENFNWINVFKNLCNNYLNTFVYCWFHPKIGLWLGATPEQFIKANKQTINTVSLAGTQLAVANKLANWTQKELEEQAIVTNYIKDVLNPYVKHITIDNLSTIKAGKLWHLKTILNAELKDAVSYRTIINTLHPTPAVCGFPKEKSKQFILQNEMHNREFYTGFLGELDNDYMDLFVNLRCMQVKDNNALLYVGGGITKASILEQEWEETVNKTKTIKNVL